jgi:hypothetical protein
MPRCARTEMRHGAASGRCVTSNWGLPRASMLHISQGSIEKFDQTPRVLTGGVQVGPEVRDADPEQPR